jgi:uroporphyrinogen III methyltransferase/synthase
MSGLVSIVGSGPGDPDLITRKGIKRLREADAVFHDKLSPDDLIRRHCSPEVEVHDVGKRKGKIGPSQDEINEMLIEASNEHERTVRLKGGDPFLFGRGGEETEFLAEHDVDFEIVPGVTSLTAVPASAGIPLTHRDHSSSVGAITGHFNRNAEDEEHDWKNLARLETLVVLMGVTRLGTIAENLLDAGKDPDTPVSVIGWGATPDQKSIVRSLGELKDGLDNPKEYLPGLIVVGDVVSCRPALNWYEKKPLFGQRIVVTRPEEQADRLAEPLREAGAKALVHPTIRIESLQEGRQDLREEFNQIRERDWLVFTSRNAVKFFFNVLEDSEYDLRILGPLNVACIGPGTAERLQKYGLTADLVPEKHRAEGLAEELLPELVPESEVLLPRSADARAFLASELENAGHDVREIPIYHTTPTDEQTREKLRTLLSESRIDMITFTSSSTVEYLFESLAGDFLRENLQIVETACIGPITAETLESHGIAADLIPENYNLDAFVQSIVSYARQSERPPNLTEGTSSP